MHFACQRLFDGPFARTPVPLAVDDVGVIQTEMKDAHTTADPRASASCQLELGVVEHDIRRAIHPLARTGPTAHAGSHEG